MFSKLLVAVFVGGVVLFGLVAHAVSFLLALPTPISNETGASSTGSGFGAAGPHPVGIRQLSDESDATVWYPAEIEDASGSVTYSYGINMLGSDTVTALATYHGDATVGAQALDIDDTYPLVVLSHGFAISPGSYGWLAEHLASWGFVVVAPQHEESLDPGALWRSTVQRPADIDSIRALIHRENVAGGSIEGLVDEDRVAVIGHSYGGYTALAAGGARVDPLAFQTSCDESYADDGSLVFLCDALLPRLSEMGAMAGVDPDDSGLWPTLVAEGVDAVISIAGDAAMFGESGLTQVTVPVMAIGGTADADSPFKWGTQLTYDSVSSARKVEIGLDGAGHLIFGGACENVRRVLSLASLGFCSDIWDRETVHELVEAKATAFLLAELVGASDAFESLAVTADQTDGVSIRTQGY